MMSREQPHYAVDMAARRILLFVVLMVALGLLAVAVNPSSDTQNESSSEPTQSSPPPPPVSQQSEVLVESELSADPSAVARTINAQAGDVVEITVTGNELAVVQILDLGLTKTIDPSVPGKFTIFADRSGTFPITLLESGRTIGVLQVSGKS